jgi:hypothetical protein
MGRTGLFLFFGHNAPPLVARSTDIVSRPIRTIRGAIDAVWGAIQRDTDSLLALRESTRTCAVGKRALFPATRPCEGYKFSFTFAGLAFLRLESLNNKDR